MVENKRLVKKKRFIIHLPTQQFNLPREETKEGNGKTLDEIAEKSFKKKVAESSGYETETCEDTCPPRHPYR